jgi:hypothetical protein
LIISTSDLTGTNVAIEEMTGTNLKGNTPTGPITLCGIYYHPIIIQCRNEHCLTLIPGLLTPSCKRRTQQRRPSPLKQRPQRIHLSLDSSSCAPTWHWPPLCRRSRRQRMAPAALSWHRTSDFISLTKP